MVAELWIPLALLAVCFILGGLPLTGWIVRASTGQNLQHLGTGNISVSAAFYHGGQGAGILAVLSEAAKGISAVLLFRFIMPGEPIWEIAGLIALVLGRFAISRGAGTTNVVWGYLVHDWRTAFLVAVIGGIGFTIIREKRIGRFSILVLLPLVTALLHPNSGGRIIAVMVLSTVIALIYQMLPDDLDLTASQAHPESKSVFKFFRGDRAILTLNQRLSPQTAGGKAARLAELKRLGYPIPDGWVLPPGDDPQPLIDALAPSPQHPLIVRSSALGEDSDVASAAGQYDSILNVTDRPSLQRAIAQCQLSYSKARAVQYRRDRAVDEAGMAVLVQVQIPGVFSGVAFSRDPVTCQGDAVIIEALPGTASQVVSGRKTPEYYRAWISEQSPKPAQGEGNDGVQPSEQAQSTPSPPKPIWQAPEGVTVTLEGSGDVPPSLIKQVAYLVRYLERESGDVPQDLEWSYDGQQLWVLQARPITTLLPVWTRKIAAEVIPGFIRPLTWSINRPLTCGVWGDIFTLVLGDRAKGLDFTDTATLHHSSAYFNATLLGEIFRRMGLPPESLEFLTRGAKFSRPSMVSTLRNLPGLMRLLRREWDLPDDFANDEPRFRKALDRMSRQDKSALPPMQILSEIHALLALLKQATYYNILAPLSAALRQTILKVPDTDLDTSALPEVAALRSLQELAASSRPLIPNLQEVAGQRSTLFAALAENPDGQTVLTQLDQFINTYGYLSDVATDIAVPTWRDDPRPVYDLFAQLLKQPPHPTLIEPLETTKQNWKIRQVQQRIDLKGTVAEIYNRLLAELRAYIISLESQWVDAHVLSEAGDIFFLTFDEIQHYVTTFYGQPSTPHEGNVDPIEPAGIDEQTIEAIAALVQARKAQWQKDAEVSSVPFLVYGKEPPLATARPHGMTAEAPAGMQLQGIGASPGQAVGTVKVVRSLQDVPTVSKDMILVVPYADSGWAPLLAQAGGVIAEVGGRLSHGAIVAREYGIPAIMDINDSTSRLQDGQRVFIDGENGTVTLL